MSWNVHGMWVNWFRSFRSEVVFAAAWGLETHPKDQQSKRPQWNGDSKDSRVRRSREKSGEVGGGSETTTAIAFGGLGRLVFPDLCWHFTLSSCLQLWGFVLSIYWGLVRSVHSFVGHLNSTCHGLRVPGVCCFLCMNKSTWMIESSLEEVVCYKNSKMSDFHIYGYGHESKIMTHPPMWIIPDIIPYLLWYPIAWPRKKSLGFQKKDQAMYLDVVTSWYIMVSYHAGSCQSTVQFQGANVI